MQKRLQCAKLNKNWTANQWHCVLWSDESKWFCWNYQYVQKSSRKRYNSECPQPSIKHGGVMVWGCISVSGVEDLVKLDGIMNTEKYHQIFLVWQCSQTMQYKYHWTEREKQNLTPDLNIEYWGKRPHGEIRSKQLLNQYTQGGSVISDSRYFESGECDTPVQPSLIVPINMTFTAEKRQRTS